MSAEDSFEVGGPSRPQEDFWILGNSAICSLLTSLKQRETQFTLLFKYTQPDLQKGRLVLDLSIRAECCRSLTFTGTTQRLLRCRGSCSEKCWHHSRSLFEGACSSRSCMSNLNSLADAAAISSLSTCLATLPGVCRKSPKQSWSGG